ncbi:MAG: hypothetical protein KC619_10315 [Myxococcales bacterium]|nr:hypothetical protein [Myxococcales bacterium]
MRLEDPRGRFLPVLLDVEIPSWEPRRQSYEEGREPVASDVPVIRTVRVRPTVERSIPPGNTAVWGLVEARPEVPSRGARVEVRTLDEHLLFRTHADHAGVFSATLPAPPRSAPAPDTGTTTSGVPDTTDDTPIAAVAPRRSMTVKVRAWPLRRSIGPDGTDLETPVDFDQMEMSNDFSSMYEDIPITPAPVIRELTVGRTTRVDLAAPVL